MEALGLGLSNLDTFSYIGSFSAPDLGNMQDWPAVAFASPGATGRAALTTPGPSRSHAATSAPSAATASQPVPPTFDPKHFLSGVFEDPAHFNQQVHLLWFGAGTAESQFNDALRANARALRAQGINLVTFESPGTAHEWLTWRRDLKEFAPLLFRP